jgi:hypothetical protein
MTSLTPTQLKSPSGQMDQRNLELQANYEIGSQLSQARQALSLMTKAVEKASDRGPGSTLAGVAIKLAFMWLGRAKGALGIPNAYPQSFNAESRTIDPETDQSIDELEIPEKADNIGKVKFLRGELNKCEKMIYGLVRLMKDHESYQLAVQSAQRSCAEATMWLGENLAEIRKRTPEKKEDKKEKDERKPQKLQSVAPSAFPKFQAEQEDQQPPAPTADKGGATVSSEAEGLVPKQKDPVAPWHSKAEEHEFSTVDEFTQETEDEKQKEKENKDKAAEDDKKKSAAKK